MKEKDLGELLSIGLYGFVCLVVVIMLCAAGFMLQH